MNVEIEVAAAQGESLAVCPKVVAVIRSFFKVVGLKTQTATSVLRSLIQGSTSMNAVSPDHILIEGGLAVA